MVCMLSMVILALQKLVPDCLQNAQLPEACKQSTYGCCVQVIRRHSCVRPLDVLNTMALNNVTSCNWLFCSQPLAQPVISASSTVTEWVRAALLACAALHAVEGAG
jgi:hypothetical protein